MHVGSITYPAHACGVVGVKPTVGLTSRAGVVPISGSQDTVGVFGRTVEDAAIALGAIASGEPDALDAATAEAAGRAPPGGDYSALLGRHTLSGANVGVREFTKGGLVKGGLAIVI